MYLIKSSFVNFWRNIWLSTAATFIMVITLAIFTITLFVVNLSNLVIKNVRQRVDISVYFNNNASEAQILSIKDSILKLPQTASINYVSAQQAMENFKSKHTTDPLILQSLNELSTNPLPPTLQIKAKQLDQYPAIVQALQNSSFQPFINKINFDDNRAVIERLNRILETVKKIGLGLAIIFCFIAVLVIFNTIRLTIYNRRDEVEIMRLVGATNWYIRWPFIFESMLYALLASCITILAFLPVFNYLAPRINNYLGISQSVSGLAGFSFGGYSFYGLGYLFVIQLLAALLLGVVSSFIAIRRYLRV